MQARKAPVAGATAPNSGPFSAARSARTSSEQPRTCGRPTLLQLMFLMVYSFVLIFGGMSLGESSLLKSLWKNTSSDGVRSAKKQAVHVQHEHVPPPVEVAAPGGGAKEVHAPEQAAPAEPQHDHGHDHGEEGTASGGIAAVHASHVHTEVTDGIPGLTELARYVGEDRALAGFSTEPPGKPGQEYPAPLPAGFYLPHDTKAAQRTIGWPSMTVRRPSDEQLEGTAFVTMATGDESARHALALVQSMRDVGSRIPHFHVMLFRGGSGSHDCHSGASRKARKRDNIACEGPDTLPVEVVSQVYLDAFERLGATVTLADPIPDTPYIKNIPGGRGIAWGMAINKLTVFGLTQYRKLLWVDSDVLVLHNVDHLLLEPDFSAAFTNDCCNRNADCKMSGGMWVLHPSKERMARIQHMIERPIPGTANDAWLFGDMQVVLYAFGRIEKATSDYREWPMSRDLRQGMVPGVRVLPGYVNMTDPELSNELLSGGRRGAQLPPPGLLPAEQPAAQAAAEALAGGKGDAEGAAWHMLDPRYDGLVGNCECLPERDLGPAYFSVHFTCLPVTPPVHKPGRYENEAEFLDHVRTRMKGCMRFYFLKWYDSYVRAMDGARFGQPYYEGPTVRIHDPEADALCDKNRKDAFDAAVAEERRRNGLAP